MSEKKIFVPDELTIRTSDLLVLGVLIQDGKKTEALNHIREMFIKYGIENKETKKP